MIEIENLSKSYGRTAIFENASFSFPDRGLVCILGPSGCGKSTLLNLLAGFDSDYQGSISVHGGFLNRMNAEELCAYRRDNVGFIFQDYCLLSGYTVLENMLLASDAAGMPGEESEKEARLLLQKLGLSEKAGQKAESLSGGQKQRAAIARALLRRPSVLFADEPTGALDRQNSNEIMELLRETARDRLVILITHDKKCAEYADEIVAIRGGKLVSENLLPPSGQKTALQKNKPGKISAFRRALKNFWVRLPRAAAVSAAISVGVFCFMLSLSSGNIMGKSIEDFQAKNTAFHNGYIRTKEDAGKVLAVLKDDSRIENAFLQFVLKDVSLSVGQRREVMAEKFPMPKAGEKMSYGVMPRENRGEIALSPSLAAKFNKNMQALIGEKIELDYGGERCTLTISGIFNASYDDFFISSDMEQKLYHGMDEAKAYSASYEVAEFENIVPVGDSLREQGLESQTAAGEVSAFLSTFHNLQRLFLIVSLLIFAMGVFISAILLVKQQNTRFREMGLLSALGYTRGTVNRILFFENLLLSAAAVLCNGVLFALALAVGKGFGFPLFLSLPQVLLSLCLTALLILTIGTLAGIRLIRMEPAQALRK